MTKDPVTVKPEATSVKASQLLRDYEIQHLPVVDDTGRYMGMVSAEDLQAVQPSKATLLDVYEISHLLSKIKVKDIMTKGSKTLTVVANDTVEHCAAVMLGHKIRSLPVLEGEKVIGIITQTDVFKVLTRITGIYRGGVVFSMEVGDQPGTIGPVANIIRKHGGRVISILSTHSLGEDGCRHVDIRALGLSKESIPEVGEELKELGTLLAVVEAYATDYEKLEAYGTTGN